MSKIEEYTYMISAMYHSLQNTKEKLADKLIKLQKLTSELKYAKYQNNPLLTSKIIKKIDVVLSDGLNIVWNMVCKQNRKITIKKTKRHQWIFKRTSKDSKRENNIVRNNYA